MFADLPGWLDRVLPTETEAGFVVGSTTWLMRSCVVSVSQSAAVEDQIIVHYPSGVFCLLVFGFFLKKGHPLFPKEDRAGRSQLNTVCWGAAWALPAFVCQSICYRTPGPEWGSKS